MRLPQGIASPAWRQARNDTVALCHDEEHSEQAILLNPACHCEQRSDEAIAFNYRKVQGIASPARRQARNGTVALCHDEERSEQAIVLNPACHCEERSDEAIPLNYRKAQGIASPAWRQARHDTVLR